MATSGWATSPQPAWYADPSDPAIMRYWDGRRWTVHTLPKAEGWGAAPPKPLSWWQTWWAVVPGLLLCLPLGLVGLWRRPGLSVWLRVGVTLGMVALFVTAGLADDSTTKPSKDESASAVAKDDAEPAPTSTAEAKPTVTASPTSVVPKLAGLSRSQAENALADAGLIVGEIRQVPSTRPRGTVLRQGTRVGMSLPTGSAVVLVVAAPYPRVPSVVGRSKSEALSRLRGEGFQVKVEVETRTSGKNGVVLRQNPGGSDRAKPHSTITIVVSSIVRPLAPPVRNCTPGYEPCLAPASDYDCAGGSGDGPAYADGPIYVTGSDPYDLDRDGDGIACES
jgi:hypothetical protein